MEYQPMTLKEIADSDEIKSIKERYGDSKDFMVDFLKECAAKGKDGFIDPFSISPNRERVYTRMRQIKLREIMGGGTGSDYLSYLLPTKIYQTVLDAFSEEDILPAIAAIDVRDFQGPTVNILWGLMDKIVPHWGGTAGGAPAMNEDQLDKLALTPKVFSVDCAISKVLVEDCAFDVIEHHLKVAGRAMAQFAVQAALEEIYAGYDVSNNAVSGSSDAITVAQLISAVGKVEAQGGAPDIGVLTRRQKSDLLADATTFNYTLDWKEAASRGKLMEGFQGLTYYLRRLQAKNGLYSVADTDYYALVFEKAKSLATAWRRPITIENYDDPRDGLVGAVLSARFDAGVTHNGDFISAILES